MELFVISFPDFFVGEASLVSSLLKQYDFTFDLRKPNATLTDIDRFLNQIPKHLHPKIIIHNHIELANKFEVKGIHFSATCRQNNKNFPNCEYLGSSCHSIEELKNLNPIFNYAYLSPLFTSISKKGYKSQFNYDEIKSYLSGNNALKTIALGGIHTRNFKQIKNMKFDGVALLGYIWTEEPSNNFELIKSNFNKIYSLMK